MSVPLLAHEQLMPSHARHFAQPPSTCGYCGEALELVSGREIYPALPALSSAHFWRCAPCAAHIECHPGTTVAQGTVAKLDLRVMRARTHQVLDPIWQQGYMQRNQSYAWLAKRMKLPIDDCHIGLFDMEACRQAQAILCGFWQRKGLPIPDPRKNAST